MAQLDNQRRYRQHITAQPRPCLVRDWQSFGVVMLIDDSSCTDLLVDRWLVRGVSEEIAMRLLNVLREAMEAMK
jgi:hypothetical protein